MVRKPSRDAAERESSELSTDTDTRRIAPGKKPQRMPSRAPSSSAQGGQSARGAARAAVQRAAHDGALSDAWMDTAVRPDLNPAPIQRSAAAVRDTGGLLSDGAGRAMPGDVQARMEAAFDTDFSSVRISEGPRSRALGARAYTQGAEIHFAPGQYQPHSESGQRLLGHELAHVVQQSQGRVSTTRQMKGVGLNDDSLLEREADDMADKAMRGERACVAGGAAPGGASTGAPVQRYIEDDPHLAPGKVSEGGAVAMVDRETVYAKGDKIDEANAILDTSTATFKLARGGAFAKPDAEAWSARFGENPAMYRVRPVFKANALSPQEAATEPVEGDSGPEENAKLAAYKDALTSKILHISDLKQQLDKRWKAEEGKRGGLLGFLESTGVPTVIWGEFNGQINKLIADTMGPMWATSPAALAIFLPQGDERNQLTLKQHLALFDSLATDYLAKLDNELAPELSMAELWMTLPNDCKNAARILTGKNEMQLNQGTADPAVGDNYSIHFPSAMKYGWATHFASVIMKDARDGNTDNVTFETAASINAGMQEGKSLGFFEMYGTENPLQTFEYISWLKNRGNVDQQVEADLAQATSSGARDKIRADRDADVGRIDTTLANLADE